MIVEISTSLVVTFALFVTLTTYLPIVAGGIIGNTTYPNTMEGREYWSIIPMPVISHFAGDESLDNMRKLINLI